MLEKKHLEAIEHWILSKGYNLYIAKDGDNTVDFEAKIISIKSASSLTTKIFTILHECGHVLIVQYDPMKIRKVSTSSDRKTMMSRVFTVIEEVEAWNRGYRLAKKLNIPIDKKKWDRAVSDAINEYMKWALEKNTKLY